MRVLAITCHPDDMGRGCVGTLTKYVKNGHLTIDSANIEQLEKITEIIRDANPDVITTHSSNNYCSDHFKASFDAYCPHFKLKLGETSGVAPIFYTDTHKGMNFVLTEYEN